MPLHPTLVVAPLVLAWLLVAADISRLRGACGQAVPLALHVLMVVACIGASLSGEAEAGRVPVDDGVRPHLRAHDAWATRISFATGGALLLRLGLWRHQGRRALAGLGLVSLLLALGILGTARLGGRLVFEHGVGVTDRTG